MKQYRIVKDGSRRLKVEIRRWWFPLWIECWSHDVPFNLVYSLEEAEEFIENHKSGFKNLKAEIKRTKWQTN